MNIVLLLVGGIVGTGVLLRKKKGGVRGLDVEIIKKFEGFSPTAYPDGVRDGETLYSIGYGHQILDGEKRRYMSGKISVSEGAKLLSRDIESRRKVVDALGVNLTDKSKAALVSFIYNVGVGAFNRSTMKKRLLSGDYNGAGMEFMRWNRSNGKVLAGLVKRRKVERDLFMSGLRG